MANIKVNHQRLLAASNQVDTYVSRLDTYMAEIDTSMVFLSSAWDGADYRQVKSEWNEIHSPESTTGKMKRALKSYVSALRQASKLYKEAQTRAINRANSLCK